MKTLPLCLLGAILLAVVDPALNFHDVQAGEPREVFELWPTGKAPGLSRAKADDGEQILKDRRRPLYQLTNISVPSISVFLAPEDKATGAAMLVCPGGGMQRLAFEHEGLEVADWLNPLGISVFVLKYRVPGPSSTALLDAQRAMGIIRQRAEEFKIDPNRLGSMGFSAGGEVSLLLATNYSERGYEPIDEADTQPCRPNVVGLIYPGGIVRRGGELREDIASKLNSRTTPEMFITHAFGDASENSLALAIKLKQARIPAEIHIYQEGGHGFGARSSGLALNEWKKTFVTWLASKGFLDKQFIGDYAQQFIASTEQDNSTALQRLSSQHDSASLADGYAAQRRIVEYRLKNDRIGGYKASATNAGAQKKLELDSPTTGVLFRSGGLDSKNQESLAIGKASHLIETELGFIVSNGVEISTYIEKEEHIKGAFEAVVAVIELPINYASRMDGPMKAADLVGINLAADKWIVGSQKISPDDIDLEAIQIVLKRNGEQLHASKGNEVLNGQWETLRVVVNQIVDQGYTLRGGDIVISGALGSVHVAEKGEYEADFGLLGNLAFAFD